MIDLSPSEPPRIVNPPPSAVLFVGPPAVNVTPFALPEPWNAWLIVTVVPETAETNAPAGSVIVPDPLCIATATPGARFDVSLQLVIVV